MTTFTITLTLPSEIRVPVAKGSGLDNIVPLEKISRSVIEMAACQGFIKALTDISDKDALPSALHGKREKRVDVWRGGDWAARTVETDPLPAQMRECLIGHLMTQTKCTRKIAESKVGKSAASFIETIAAKKHSADETARKAFIESETAKWRDKAEAIIAERREAAAAVAVSDDDLVDLF